MGDKEVQGIKYYVCDQNGNCLSEVLDIHERQSTCDLDMGLSFDELNENETWRSCGAYIFEVEVPDDITQYIMKLSKEECDFLLQLEQIAVIFGSGKEIISQIRKMLNRSETIV